MKIIELYSTSLNRSVGYSGVAIPSGACGKSHKQYSIQSLFANTGLKLIYKMLSERLFIVI